MLRSLILAAAVLAVGAADASALTLDATRGDVGWIDLRVTGRPGTTVTVTEEGNAVTEIALRSDTAVKDRASQWVCGRPVRRFSATDGAETAEAQVTTPGCAGRLALFTKPFAPRAGGRVVARVLDHWRLGGLEARVCFAGRCRDVRIRRGRPARTVRLKATRPGIRTVTATAFGRRLRQAVEVRRRGRPLTLLATGDSMIQYVDTSLKERLRGRMGVGSDARIATGISKLSQLDWVELARRQALSRHPNVTVMFIGANDGFPIGGVQCCGEAWIDRYAGRVRRMIGSYRRRGAAKVYWLNLPVPRDPDFARIYRAVNQALAEAAPALDGAGRIIDIARVFTPGGRFRTSIGGRVVRQSDGVHLNQRGASIAAGIVIRRMRRDGVL